MSRILVNLDHLQQLCTQLQQASDQMHSMDGRIRNLQSSLDFQGRQRDGLDDQMVQARNQANNLAGLVDSYARSLTRKAQDLGDADRHFAQVLSNLSSGSG